MLLHFGRYDSNIYILIGDSKTDNKSGEGNHFYLTYINKKYTINTTYSRGVDYL